jgi:DNA-binding transcriptional LysR family regulator
MELYQLKTFVTVAELGHLTRAAERLHISQPAVSGQMRSLEEELGVALFERVPGGSSLTRAGAHLLPFAEKVLAAATDLRGEVQSMQGRVQGKLRVGTVSDPTYLRLGEFLSGMVERYPLIEIELHKEVSGDALDQLRSGELDATYFFGKSLPLQTDGIRLGEMTYRVIAPLEWKSRVAKADWADIAAMPWIMMPESSAYHLVLMDAFGERGLEPQKIIESDQASVITDLVASGVGLSLAREEIALAGRDAGRWVLWEPARLEISLWFVHMPDSARDPAVQALVKGVSEVWAEPSVSPLVVAARVADAAVTHP